MVVAVGDAFVVGRVIILVLARVRVLFFFSAGGVIVIVTEFVIVTLLVNC